MDDAFFLNYFWVSNFLQRNLFDTQIFYLLCYLTLKEIIFHFLVHPDSKCDLKRVALHSSAQIHYWLHPLAILPLVLIGPNLLGLRFIGFAKSLTPRF